MTVDNRLGRVGGSRVVSKACTWTVMVICHSVRHESTACSMTQVCHRCDSDETPPALAPELPFRAHHRGTMHEDRRPTRRLCDTFFPQAFRVNGHGHFLCFSDLLGNYCSSELVGLVRDVEMRSFD